MKLSAKHREWNSLACWSMHFDSIQASVKLAYTSGSYGYYKLHVGEMGAQNETAHLVPRMDFMCTLAYFGKHFESVCAGANVFAKMCSDRYFKPHADKQNRDTKCS